MQPTSHRPSGMAAFIVIWIGQLISILGSALTGFALPIWVYGQTQEATPLALLGFCFVAPMLAFSPFAGAIVDRSNRKLMLMLSDLAAGLTTVIILILYASGHLQVWHMFITNAISGFFHAFQFPAYSAAVSTMVSKAQYGRVNGAISVAEAAPSLIAPFIAAALLGVVGLQGILVIDIITFVFAIGALLLVHVPQPARTVEGQKGSGSLLREALYGFEYIWQRRPLLGLQLVFLAGNFAIGIPQAVLAALVLARSGMDAAVLATVATAGAVGGVLGGVAMSAWGGPRPRVHGVLGGWFFTGLVQAVLMGMGRHVWVWASAAFLGAFIIPILNGSNQAIWQAKVAPDVQGRVFSIRRLIAWFVSPLAMLIAGPLADKILEPAMQEGQALVGIFGGLVGVGAGAGMALMFLFGGLAAAAVGLLAYTFTEVRNAEALLPDHDALERVQE